jgi:hypothetical protein
MTRHLPVLAAALVLAALLLGATGAQETRPAEKGTFLGLLFGPLPKPAPVEPADARFEARTGGTSAPPGPAGKSALKSDGVLITHVLPGSPAAKAGLRRNDILLRYDRVKVRDCEQLARLIRDDKPERKVKLLVQRDNRELAVDATLTLGPALKIASGPRKGDLAALTEATELLKRPPTATNTTANSWAKGRGPGVALAPDVLASVSVVATPLDAGKMKLTIAFYANGRLHQTLTCQGAADDLASTVQKLPERERNLVRAALQRLRTINQPAAMPSATRPAAKR